MLRPGTIAVTVRNDGPDAVRIAQATTEPYRQWHREKALGADW